MPAGLARDQHLGKQRGEIEPRRAFGNQSVVPAQQVGVVVAGRRVDREHARGIADADDLAAGETPVHVAREGREESHVPDVRLVVDDRLVKVGDRPAQRDVHAEQLGQLGRGRSGRGVAPGAERHEKLVVRAECEIAVHHRRDPDRAERRRHDAVRALHIGDEIRERGLEAGPDGIQRIGPHTIDELVLPLVAAHGDHCRRILTDQARLDPGGSEFDAEGGATRLDQGADRIAVGTVLFTAHGFSIGLVSASCYR